MAKIHGLHELEIEDQLAEERFLLLVQMQIRRLLKAKQLKYRDLSKRIGVSEARISQMLGDDPTNLTIRSVARIYHQLGETPILRSLSEENLSVSYGGETCSERSSWLIIAPDADRMLTSEVEMVANDEVARFRAPKHRDWIEAEPQMRQSA